MSGNQSHLRGYRLAAKALREYLGDRTPVSGIEYFTLVNVTKRYAPNGKREVARRAAQIAKRSAPFAAERAA